MLRRLPRGVPLHAGGPRGPSKGASRTRVAGHAERAGSREVRGRAARGAHVLDLRDGAEPGVAGGKGGGRGVVDGHGVLQGEREVVPGGED